MKLKNGLNLNVFFLQHMKNKKLVEYNHLKIEPKWRKVWEKKGINKTKEPASAKATASRGKFYVLDMFPYPSGDGLHVGHPRGYIATDIYSRFKKMQGFGACKSGPQRSNGHYEQQKRGAIKNWFSISRLRTQNWG
jgi:hypothetical protein